jgi:polysaccharide biosynthesis/export protein
MRPATARVDPRSYSAQEFFLLLRRRRRFLVGTLGALLLLCLIYCVVAPNQYEATARVALRMQPVSSLSLEAAETLAPASILSTPLQLETLANVLRAEQLEWRVITSLKLYQSAAFVRNFSGRFPGFDALHPGAEAQGYLLERFGKRLQVRALPRTLLIEVRFRSKDAALSAQVVNELIRDFMAEESEARTGATTQASAWLDGQLRMLTAQAEAHEKRLAAFEREHGFMSTQQQVAGGTPIATLHDPAVQQIDETGRLLAAASGDRILREALYRQAQEGNPEQVLASNPELQAEMGPGGAALVQQLRTHLSEIAVELAELKAEHGPNYPRVVELVRAQADLEAQVKAEDANLVESFERSWKAAAERERLLQQQMEARMADGLRENDAAIQYSVLLEQVVAERELCLRLRQRIAEAGLAAGVHASSITIVDAARAPYRPVAPDPVLYLAITLFAGFWVALGGALVLDLIRPVRLVSTGVSTGLALCVFLLAASHGWGQAPTPSTSGLPTGVVKLPEDAPAGIAPNPKTAPPVWNSLAPANAQVLPEGNPHPALGAAMALPIAAGDFVEVSEFHTPEFHTSARVAADGTVALPLVGQLSLLGMSEQRASRAIEKAFLDEGILLHPQVSVLVVSAAGQDVSVLGEVARPGVYPYTLHHRLLDLISAASGLGPNAGRLVNITHREDAHISRAVVLDPNGTDGKVEHNPELAPGDTVQVSRAGLVYVIGDVVRPGGFAVDPVQGLTVVQALSLAWGATPNAAVSKAILIRDQPGGRTLTTLDLHRMIRGRDPDLPVRDRDILFIPDSATKNLLNKSLEAAIQSAIGVTIYAGLVYSQRF